MIRRTFRAPSASTSTNSSSRTLAACGADNKWADDAVLRSSRFVSPEPPSITLFTVIGIPRGEGSHSALMINGSQRVIFDPAGSWQHPQIPERHDVLYGITDNFKRFYIDYHARETYWVSEDRVQVTREVAEPVIRQLDAEGTPFIGLLYAGLILTGEGRAFCAGMDLSVGGNVFGLAEGVDPGMAEVTEGFHDPAVIEGIRDTGGRVSLAAYACPKPIIAAINGPAVGIGATMTLPMDARLMSTKGRIGFVFGKIGIVPEACSTWFLPRIVGLPTALELAYTGDIVDATRALELGLVRSVHEPDELLPAAYELAARFTRYRSPVGIALTRQMMYRNSAQPHPVEAHRVESLAMWWTSFGDGEEGVASFLEKRDPLYTSRVSQDMPPFHPWQRED